MNPLKISAYVGLTFILLLSAIVTNGQNNSWNPCHATRFPDVAELPNPITIAECPSLVKGALDRAPRDKKEGLANLLFVWSFASRIEACYFLSMIGGSAYTLAMVKYENMHPVLFLMFVFGFFAMCVDANHADWLGYGKNDMVTDAAKAGGAAFTIFWIITLPLLGGGFVGSYLESGKVKKA